MDTATDPSVCKKNCLLANDWRIKVNIETKLKMANYHKQGVDCMDKKFQPNVSVLPTEKNPT